MPSSRHNLIGSAALPVSTLVISIACAFVCGSAAAQWVKPHSPQMPAPPPMKFVSRDEREQLNAAGDPKAHTRLAIELAGEHLTRAEQFTSQKEYDAAAEEMGRYLGLVDDTLSFLSTMNSDKAKTRDLYRHLDIALRGHLPRLTLMRRTTPVEYAINIKAAEDYVRNARSDALDSFYGHTVIKDDADKKSDKATKNPTSTPETKHP